MTRAFPFCYYLTDCHLPPRPSVRIATRLDLNRLTRTVQNHCALSRILHAGCGRPPSLLQRKGSPLLIDPNETDRDQNGLQPQEAHPHPDVLRLAVRVRKELLHAPDPPVLGVVNPIAHVFFRRLEPFADGFCSVYHCIIRLRFLSYDASLPGSFLYKRRASANGFAATKKGVRRSRTPETFRYCPFATPGSPPPGATAGSCWACLVMPTGRNGLPIPSNISALPVYQAAIAEMMNP